MSLYRVIEDTYINEFGILGRLFKNKEVKKEPSGSDNIYFCCYFEKPVGSTFELYGDTYNNAADAVRSLLVILFNLKKESDRYIMNKSDFDKLNRETKPVYLYKGTTTFKEDTHGRLNVWDYKVDEVVFKGTMKELVSKYDIKFEVNDNSSIIRERTKIYNDLLKISKEIIKESMTKFPRKHCGFGPATFEEDDEKERFLSGMTNEIDVIHCDAWDFCDGKARDDSEYRKYTDVFNWIFGQCREKMSNYGTIDYGGDWDDGPIYLTLKNK